MTIPLSDIGEPTAPGPIVLHERQIQTVVAEMGGAIADRFAGQDLRLITVLKGGLFFTADLCRAIECPLALDFLAVAPYTQGVGGVVRLTKDLSDDIEDATVILVEDVVDTGLTINYVLSLLKARNPRSLCVASLLDKPARRIADIPIEFRGFEMPDRFLVGYGLDIAGRYRNCRDIHALPDELAFP